ncbi:Ferredoxin [Sinosporangium album]|uniref:Ferredoxin n=1 Tax=Sinosporangium album TaxID=504805 RepID=A0A1G8IG09_9ACTN|nr:Ferredoxin [Sinosporangium album]
MRISVDSDRCVGAGQCVLSAPEVFDQDAEGLVTALTFAPDPGERDAVRQAVELCPSHAITVHDHGQGHSQGRDHDHGQGREDGRGHDGVVVDDG